MRIVALLCAGCLLAGCAGAPSRQAPEPVVDTPPESAPAPPANPPAPSPRPIDIAAVGDIMLGTTYPEDGYDRLPPDDAAGTFADTASILRAADIAFGNLEGVMRDGGEPFKVCKNPAFCYLFRMPARYVQHLADAGFDVVSLANRDARATSRPGGSRTAASRSSRSRRIRAHTRCSTSPPRPRSSPRSQRSTTSSSCPSTVARKGRIRCT
jgi:hypothetical protein